MIELYLSPSSTVRTAAEAAIPGPIWAETKIHVGKIRDELPPRADVVLQVGKSAPSIVQERMARNLRAAMVCLPETSEYLQGRVIAASNQGKDFIMIDAGIATTKVVLK